MIVSNGALLFVAGELEVFNRDVSSTYASPICDIRFPLGVSSSKQLYFTAIDHNMGSRTTAQIDGDAQLP